MPLLQPVQVGFAMLLLRAYPDSAFNEIDATALLPQFNHAPEKLDCAQA